MTKLCKIVCYTFLGLVTLLFVVSLDVVNAPVAKASETPAIVVGWDANPIQQQGDQWQPNIRVRLNSGIEVMLHEAYPNSLVAGDHVRIISWERRIFGYKTTFERE